MNPHDIIAEIDAYSAQTGFKATTICERALGNSRFYARLKRRLDNYEDEARRLREFMAANPPRTNEGAT